jgi:hypothetical protein
LTPLRRRGCGLALMFLGAGCTSVLGDGRYYVVDPEDGGEGSADAMAPGGDAALACKAAAVQCTPDGVQTCSASGVWGTPQSCPFGCSRGACTGTCVPGQTQCAGVVRQTCDSTGSWRTTQTCPFACGGAGTCVGFCSPNTSRCSGSTPQTCDQTGNWQSQPACAQPVPDCHAGTCACLETVCGNACADLQSDGHNCGACGHDCQGQPCQKGLCQPTTLASSLSAPWGIAVGTTNVYWANSGDGTVMTVPLAGGVTPTTLATGQGTPLGVVLDTADAYWVDNAGGVVLQCALGGCGGVPRVLSNGLSTPWGIAVDSTSVYWTAGSAVARAALTDATPSAVGTDPMTAYAIAVDGISAYWADSVGSVFKCPVGGCSSPTPLATSILSGLAQGLTIDSGNVYWTNVTTGTVSMVAKSGGSAVPLAAGQNAPIGIAVDGTTVYWANNGDGTLMKMTIAGGSPVTIATGQSGPFSVGVDSSYVYWTNQTGGTVMRVVK